MGAVILKLRSDKFLKLKSFLFFSFFSKIFLFSSILKMNSSFRLLMVAIVATALLQTFVAGGGPGLRQDERVLFVKRNGKKMLRNRSNLLPSGNGEIGRSASGTS